MNAATSSGGGKPNYVFDGAGALPSTFFRIVRPLRAIGVRRGREGHPGGVRPTALFASHVAGNAERAPAASVKAGMQRDEFVFAGVEPRQLHGAFNGFGAAIAEKVLVRPRGAMCAIFSARSATGCT